MWAALCGVRLCVCVLHQGACRCAPGPALVTRPAAAATSAPQTAIGVLNKRQATLAAAHEAVVGNGKDAAQERARLDKGECATVGAACKSFSRTAVCVRVSGGMSCSEDSQGGVWASSVASGAPAARTPVTLLLNSHLVLSLIPVLLPPDAENVQEVAAELQFKVDELQVSRRGGGR